MVLSSTIENPVQTISLENLSNGIYYFTISASKNNYQGKIIKN
jgi:hypothetical protein